MPMKTQNIVGFKPIVNEGSFVSHAFCGKRSSDSEWQLYYACCQRSVCREKHTFLAYYSTICIISYHIKKFM